MTIFFMASETEAFQVVGTVTINTNSDNHNALLSRGAMTPAASSHLERSESAISSGEYWTRGNVIFTTSPAGPNASNMFRILDSGGVTVVDLNWPNAGGGSSDAFLRFRNSSGVMTNISGNIGPDVSNVLFYMDIEIDFTGNTISIYKNDILLFASGSLDFTNIPDAETIKYIRIQGFGFLRVSEIIIADEQTIDMRVATLFPNGNGAVQGWDAGDFTDIDDLDLNTGDVLESGTVGQEATFLQPGIDNSFSTRPVRGVSFTPTARENGAGPSTIDIGYRHDGSQFYPFSLALQAGFLSDNFFESTNAGTGLAFTVADVNALQLAYRSAT